MTALTDSGDKIERVAFPPSWGRRAAWIALVAYTLYALSTLEITPERFLRGLSHGGDFSARMWPPKWSPPSSN